MQIIKVALDDYISQELIDAEIKHQKQVWLNSGFIASGDAQEDGSVNYKKHKNSY